MHRESSHPLDLGIGRFPDTEAFPVPQIPGLTPLTAVPTDPAPAAPHPVLDPEHMAKLKGSGLSPETIARAEIYTERDPAKLRDLLTPAGLQHIADDVGPVVRGMEELLRGPDGMLRYDDAFSAASAVWCAVGSDYSRKDGPAGYTLTTK